MKKVFYLLGLAVLFIGNQLVAQDNPCGVEGVVVEASSFQYAPAALEIEAGQTVVWVNMGGTHDVNGLASTLGDTWNNPETFYIGSVTGNMSGVCIGSHTFTVEGTYNYDCSIGSHAASGMVASITVNPAQTNTVADVIANSDDHTLLEAALDATGLVDALSGEGPFTVFAPDDAAINALMTVLDITAEQLLAFDGLVPILQKHVVTATALSTDLSNDQMIETLLGEDVTVTIVGDAVYIDDAQVTFADIIADNGVVHVINGVLLPSTPPTTTVVDIIVNSDDHTLLEAAVGAAGLVDALSGEGPFTVFAPTDAAVVAFTEALEITADELLALPNLGDILQYHVVGAAAYAADLSDGQMIETLQGGSVTVSITAEGVFINNAQVTVADLEADNGVVHVINAVLLPTVGVAEMASFELNIFPNPATDVFNISGVWEAGAQIEVFEMTGRKVFETTTTASTVSVSTEGWESGTYAVRIADGERTATRLFLVD